jgi:hypothetical protein
MAGAESLDVIAMIGALAAQEVLKLIREIMG